MNVSAQMTSKGGELRSGEPIWLHAKVMQKPYHIFYIAILDHISTNMHVGT